MPNAVETIGTGETYTTIQAWEDALDAAHYHEGQCKAEVFATFAFSGGTAYTATNYPHLTSVDGAQHDGRAHEVSGAGNARIEGSTSGEVVLIADEWVRMSWMEIKGPGDNTDQTIDYASVSACDMFIHHCIVHNNHVSNSAFNTGIECGDGSPDYFIYRNIVYGTGSSGIDDQTGNDLYAFNTIYECNFNGSTGRAGFFNVSNGPQEITANACFDNGFLDIDSTNGVLDYNATSDASGAEGANRIANLTATDQFVNATTTFADTDLLLKAGADLIDAGPAPYSSVTYPEIDVSIDNRGVSITGTWDIGASQFVGVGAEDFPVNLSLSNTLAISDTGKAVAGSDFTLPSIFGIQETGSKAVLTALILANELGIIQTSKSGQAGAFTLGTQLADNFVGLTGAKGVIELATDFGISSAALVQAYSILTLVNQLSVIFAAKTTGQGLLTLDSQFGISETALKGLQAFLILDESLGITESAIKSAGASLSLDGQFGISHKSALELSTSLTLAQSLGILLSATGVGEFTVFLTLSTELGISSQSLLDLKSAFFLDSEFSFDQLGSKGLQEIIELAANYGVSLSALAATVSSFSLGADLGLIESALASQLSTIELSTDFALTVGGQSAALAVLALSYVLSDQFVSSELEAIQALSLALEQGIDFTIEIERVAALNLASQFGITNEAQAEAIAGLTLEQVANISLLGSAIKNAGLTLDSILSISQDGAFFTGQVITPAGRRFTIILENRKVIVPKSMKKD